MSEERIYSVIVTEEELRLFSEFLGQKEFEEPDSVVVVDPAQPSVETTTRRQPEFFNRVKRAYHSARGIARDAKDTVRYNLRGGESKVKNILESNERGDLATNHRMTGRFLNEVAPERGVKIIADRQKDVVENFKRNNDHSHVNGRFENIANNLSDKRDDLRFSGNTARLSNDLIDLYEGESKLLKSGYDDKYASKGMERIMRKRLKGDDFQNIVNKRLEANKQYKKAGDIDTSTLGGKVKDLGQNIGRKWNDASIVYGEGTDGRSLGTDAAIAAGALAATGLALHAIRKRRKKKQAQEEALNNKFKTSGE